MSTPLDTPSSEAVRVLKEKLERFVFEECQPAEKEFDSHLAQCSGNDRWSLSAIPECMNRLQNRAKELGLWNLFLTQSSMQSFAKIVTLAKNCITPPCAITHQDYGILCEILGQSFLAPEACNCSAPDTGNMEVLLHHGTVEQQTEYLLPLLQGHIRSAFLMTEPDVASSDATNISMTTLTKFIDDSGCIQYRLHGRKWWSSGAMDPRCTVCLVLAKMDYSHPSLVASKQHPSQYHPNLPHHNHTLVIVPISQITLLRPLQVFGYDDAPHGHAECLLENILLPPSSIILGEGRGFEIAQGRLGPGRIHHCMRAVGIASRCYQLMLHRLQTRKTFGKFLYEHGSMQDCITDSLQDLQSARLLTLYCASQMDRVGTRSARKYIALIKVAVPSLTIRVVDRAIQVFGAAGLSQDFILARSLVALRSLRIADGPDAVHKRTIAGMEISRAKIHPDSKEKRDDTISRL